MILSSNAFRRISIWLAVVLCGCAGFWILGDRVDPLWCELWGPCSLTNEAYQALERGDRDGAIKYANMAVKCRPNMEMTLYCRAAVLETCGNFPGALRDYTKVEEISLSLVPRAGRGRVYEKMGELDKAAAVYCAGIRRVEDVRSMALFRVLEPLEVDQRPNAVPLLLKFIREAIEREPEGRELLECRELILRYQAEIEEI